MGLFEDAQRDMADLMSDPDLGTFLDLRSPDGQTARVTGRHIRHNQKFDFNNGTPLNALNASASLSTKDLAAKFPDYPFRNSDATSEHFGKIDLKGHLLEAADLSGTIWRYKVIENKADDTVGLVVLTLSPYRE